MLCLPFICFTTGTRAKFTMVQLRRRVKSYYHGSNITLLVLQTVVSPGCGSATVFANFSVDCAILKESTCSGVYSTMLFHTDLFPGIIFSREVTWSCSTYEKIIGDFCYQTFSNHLRKQETGKLLKCHLSTWKAHAASGI